jgi:4-amino-4-deoxy-L-arabinose transferase-like glycosyltransferase
MISMSSPADARARRARNLVIALAVLCFGLLRAPYLSVPLERDEGEYAYIAQRMLAGDMPYRDAFDQKPPAIFFVYLGTLALLGESVEAIRVAMHLWTAATGLLLFALVHSLAGGLAAGFALLVFAISTTDPALHSTAANTEIFMLLPMVASVGCLLRGLATGGTRWWLACGFLAAAACWFKQVGVTNALFVVAFAVVELARRSEASAKRIARDLGFLALGGIAASAPIVLYFVARGAWQPFLDSVFLHNLAYSRALPLDVGISTLLYALGQQLPGFAAVWLLTLVALLRPGLAGWRSWALLAGWLVACLAGVSFGLRFRSHYFVQGLPPLAALAGIALGSAAAWVLARPRAAAAWGGLAALLLVAAAPPVAAAWSTLRAGSPEAIARKIYGFNPFPEAVEIAKYIRHTSTPEDTVYIVGSEPEILFYAGRRSATRYIFFYPLTESYEDVLERQQGVVDEVRASRPLYVVWAEIPDSLPMHAGTRRLVFDATAAMLERDYLLEFVVRADLERETFEFVYGTEAGRWVLEAQEQGLRLPWIAVYRRSS